LQRSSHLGGAHGEAQVGLLPLPQVLRDIVPQPAAVGAVAWSQVCRLVQALVAAKARRQARKLAKQVLTDGLQKQGNRGTMSRSVSAQLLRQLCGYCVQPFTQHLADPAMLRGHMDHNAHACMKPETVQGCKAGWWYARLVSCCERTSTCCCAGRASATLACSRDPPCKSCRACRPERAWRCPTLGSGSLIW
jgi:hypothetical protein